jgi:hypothetical protein
MLYPSSLRPVLAAFFAITILVCQGQQEEKVVLQFLSFPKAIDPKPVELLIGDGKTTEVKIPTNEFSENYSVTRLKKWVVGKTEIGNDGKPAFKVFGEGAALDSPKQLILLVRKGKENEEGMVVIPIDIQQSTFGGGSFLFLNAASLDLAGVLGETKFVVKPGKFIVTKPSPAKDEPLGLVQASFFYSKDEEVKPLFNSTWPLNKQARTMVVFYEDPETGRLTRHSIRDFLDP